MLRRLLPKGSAFQAFFGTDWYNFLDGLSDEPERISGFYEDVRDSGIPGLIPHDALADWEEFLFLSDGSALTDEERNNRITAKVAQVGGGGPDYIEDILETEFQEDFEILENLTASFSPFAGPTCGDPVITCGSGVTCAALSANGLLIVGPPSYYNKKLFDVTCSPFLTSTCEGTVAFGGTMTCGRYTGIDILERVYELPTDPSLWPLIWFITGPGGLNDFVDLPLARREDFIKTVIALKPAHTWVIAQVNFV